MVKNERAHRTHKTHPMCYIGECVYSVRAQSVFLIIGSSSWKEMKNIKITHTHTRVYNTSHVNAVYGVSFLGHPNFFGLRDLRKNGSLCFVIPLRYYSPDSEVVLE